MRRTAQVAALWIGVAAMCAAEDKERPQPKTGGTDNDPLIQLELAGADDSRAEALLAVLNQCTWASRTAVLPGHEGKIAKDRWLPKAAAALAVGERQWADVSDLATQLRTAGFTVSAIHLTEFGTVRIRAQFGFDEPPQEAREKIEAVYQKLPWLLDARFTDAGTKPDFKLAKKAEVRAEFLLSDSQTIEVAGLLDGLREAGFPPQSLRVARMFAGVPFGFPMPGDVELADAAGVKLSSGALRKTGRPLVLVFFPLTGKYKQDKEDKTYRAEPVHFAGLKDVALRYADKADFVAISSAKDDAPADVAALWEKAAMPFPCYRDGEQKLATTLSASLANPPPHIFILDADGKLRYAGEFADGWIEPAKIKRVFLAEALDLVLARKYAPNGAVFYNSPACACSVAGCKCPKCGCGGPCRCGCSTGAG
jgi:peroxiredoxin